MDQRVETDNRVEDLIREGSLGGVGLPERRLGNEASGTADLDFAEVYSGDPVTR